MCAVGFADSIALANRLIEQSAVRINGDLVETVDAFVPSSCFLLSVGKTQKANVSIEPEGIR